jgi:hypothetical protein
VVHGNYLENFARYLGNITMIMCFLRKTSEEKRVTHEKEIKMYLV